MRFPVTFAFALCVLSPLLPFTPATIHAQNTGAGALDPTFNTPTIPLDRGITFLRLLPDGGFVAGGEAADPASRFGTFPRLARFGPDGSLVPGYGANALTAGSNLSPREVDAAGRLLFVNLDAPDRLRRLNADGTPDATFSFPRPAGWSDLTAVAVQPDGKILVGGRFARPFTGTPRLALVRLLPDGGALDNGFQPGAAPRGGFGDVAAILPVPGSGQLLVGSRDYQPGVPSADATPSTRLGRRNADGSPDTTFRTAEADYELGALALQPPAGDVLVSVYRHNDKYDRARVLLRLRGADGTVDDTFQPVAPGLTNVSPLLAVQGDGRLLVGLAESGSIDPSTLVRLLADGRTDPTFQSAVRVMSLFAPNVSRDGRVGPLLVQPDGRPVLAVLQREVGGSYNNYLVTTKVDLVRFLADPFPKRADLAVTFPDLLKITRPDPAAPTVGKYKLAGTVRLLNRGNKSLRDFSVTAYATTRPDLYTGSPGQPFNAAADPSLRPLQLTALTDEATNLVALRARFDPAATAPAVVRVRKLSTGASQDVFFKLTYAASQEATLQGASLLLVLDAENRYPETDEVNNARVYYSLP